MKLSYNWIKRYWNTDQIDSPEQYISKLNNCGLTLEKTTYLNAKDGKVSEDDIVWDIDLPEYRDDLLCMMWNAKESCGMFQRKYGYDTCYYGVKSPSYEWTKSAIDERHNLFHSLTAHSHSESCDYILAQYIGSVDPKGKLHDFINDQVYVLGFDHPNIFEAISVYCARNCGCPLYIFDANKIENAEFSIENAKEKGYITYNAKKYIFEKGDLVFVTGNKVFGIGGVIFDDEYMANDNTDKVIIASANIDKRVVKKIENKIGVKTFNSLMSSYGSNPKSIEKIVGNATSYLFECASADKIENQTVMCKTDLQRRYIKVSVSKINQILGSELTYEQIANALEMAEVLALDPDDQKETFFVKLTSYNRDIDECDLANRLINYLGHEIIGNRENV